MTSGHRERASSDLSCDLAVRAGAGSGKTTVLVNRYVAIARQDGLGPERILAITFTRKAAVEMKERAIRLFEAANETLLRRKTEAAHISTIHGFCERLLRERPFDARIDPSFAVLTDFDQKLFYEEALETMYARPSLRTLAPRLGKEFGGGWSLFQLVRDVARLIREGPSSARSEAMLIDDVDAIVTAALARARDAVDGAAADMLECLRKLGPMLEAAPFKSRGKLFQQRNEYLAALADCLSRGSVRGAGDAWTATRFTSEIPAELREDIRALLDAVKAHAPIAVYDDWALQETLERELVPLKCEIYAAALEIERTYQEHKQRIGSLDFHDLQRRARDLLAENRAVRAEYGDRFRHILLDEAQDTDELQYEIIQSLRTPDNTLFMVGDPKQAIYEFRGANPRVFHAAVEKLRADQQLDLVENFRSRPEIVAFINGFGAALLPGQFSKISGQANYDGVELNGPAVSVFYAPKTDSLADARAREAGAVCEELARLLRDRPMVRDPATRDARWVPLAPRHIALLFRTRTVIPYFEHALAVRGIPYVTASGQGFYERAEVLDCLMMLRAIDQPLDDLALAAVLRSPFAGASDADLWELRASWRASGEREHVPPLFRDLESYAPLAGFHTAFAALRKRVRGRSAGQALDDAIRTFGYELAIAASADGPAMLANLEKVRRILRELGAIGPAAAYDELVRRRELLAAEAMAPLVGPSDDVVVLTTIHQAKGLEWPVVCLPNLQSPPKGSRTAFSDRHGVLLCKALDENDEQVEPLSIARILDEAKRSAEAEERRLLYVALTRARERLLLSASVTESQLQPSAKSAFTPLSFLLLHTGGELTGNGEHDCGAYRTIVRSVDEMPPVASFESDGTLRATLRPAVLDQPPREPVYPLPPPLSLKVTELLSYRRCPQVYRFSHDLEISEHIPRRAVARSGDAHAPSAVERGTIVHGLLERARFDATDRDTEIERLLADEPAEWRERLRPMLSPVLSGEIGTLARSARRLEREWPFATIVGGVMIEGVIDLAIQRDDGGWTLVDYKSNDLSRTGRLEYLRDYYMPQLELYALAVSRARLGAITELVLVFLDGHHVVRQHFDANASPAGTWPRDAVAAIAAGNFATSAGPKCEQCGYRKRKVCDIGRSWMPQTAGAAVQRPSMADVDSGHPRST